jgi:MFS superfamily sulfate permease-like transporter
VLGERFSQFLFLAAHARFIPAHPKGRGTTKEDFVMPNQKETIRRGFPGLKQNFKHDLIAGFSVSLIALPLSLGIALASGMPPLAGLITAIIGGIFASRLTGSFVTISGPAAGLIVIVLGAVESLGGGDQVVGYPFALAAILIAGGIVTLFGLLKVGKLGGFFPSAAVHGMLAAIGVIIMVKQAYVAMGVTAPKGELLELIAHLPIAFKDFNPEVMSIALVAIAVLLIHPRIRLKWVKMIPAPLWVLVVSIPMAHFWDLFHLHHYHFLGNDFELGPKFLVNLPDKITDGIVFPDFGKVATGAFWFAVMSIALVGGLESLLSAKAVDSLDPWKRKTNLNKDLIALGGGTALAGFLGGLPMISEIVRSSANINNGGRTQWANFFHGIFLLIFVLLLAPLIQQIPLSALGAMLIFTGFRLAAPKQFTHMYHVGIKQFAAFVITLVMVIATDLLVGIAAGILVEFILHLFTGASLKRAFSVKCEIEESATSVRVSVYDSVTFSNYLSLESKVLKNARKPLLILDVSHAKMLDHTVMTNLAQIEDALRKRTVEFRLDGLNKLQSVSGHATSDHIASIGTSKNLKRKLSVRQMEMLVLSMENQYQYMPRQLTHLEIWDDFSFLDGAQIQKVENRLEVNNCGADIMVADVATVTGALLTASENVTTYMLVRLPGSKLPDFRLETETVMDRLLNGMNTRDIDFDSHKKFSDLFMLQGADETAIRSFFRPSLLDLLQEAKDVEIEAMNGAILVRKRKGLVPIEEVEDFVKFGCDLATAIGVPA